MYILFTTQAARESSLCCFYNVSLEDQRVYDNTAKK